MLIVGITGGICSGKSAVSEYIVKKGHVVIDCDKITDELYTNKNFTDGIYRLFGKKILYNGEVNRGKLGSLIFGDDEKRQKLNNYCLPLIFNAIQEKLNYYKNEEIVFIDAPTLFESGLNNFIQFNEIWVVSVEIYTQIRRLRKRKSYLSSRAIRNILNSQLTNIERCSMGTYIINNNSSSRKDLYIQIENGLNNLLVTV